MSSRRLTMKDLAELAGVDVQKVRKYVKVLRTFAVSMDS